MKRLFIFTVQIVLIVAAIVTAGGTKKATSISVPQGYKTVVHDELTTLPPPKVPIVVAVYKFRDQTGQYKASESGQTWSTAVTQGATSMLIKALEDSRWFIPVEREGLSDLLNERKIITSTRESFAQQNKEELSPLPPLLYAGIILEGGIIAYESNTITAGAGVRYFGLGSDVKVSQDRVTIYLRAVSTQTGQVLKTVYTTKTILSKQINAGLYRFVRFKRLLEAEAGISNNEPVQLCVMDAIERAVMSLIIEGILDKKWFLQNEKDFQTDIIQKYIKENEQQVTDTSIPSQEPGKVRVGGSVGFQWVGYGKMNTFKPAGAIQIGYTIGSYYSSFLSIGAGKIQSSSNNFGYVVSVDLKGECKAFPEWRITPCFFPGIGIAKSFLLNSKENQLSSGKSASGGILLTYTLGGGIRYRLNASNFIILEAENHRTFSDGFHAVKDGGHTDNYWTVLTGVSMPLPKFGKKK